MFNATSNHQVSLTVNALRVCVKRRKRSNIPNDNIQNIRISKSHIPESIKWEHYKMSTHKKCTKGSVGCQLSISSWKVSLHFTTIIRPEQVYVHLKTRHTPARPAAHTLLHRAWKMWIQNVWIWMWKSIRCQSLLTEIAIFHLKVLQNPVMKNIMKIISISIPVLKWQKRKQRFKLRAAWKVCIHWAKCIRKLVGYSLWMWMWSMARAVCMDANERQSNSGDMVTI